MSEVDQDRSARSVADGRRTETVDWYSEGESRTVILDGRHFTVRFVGRKGRRGRIVISAPAGARFVEQ